VSTDVPTARRFPIPRPPADGPSVRAVVRVLVVLLVTAGLLWLVYVSRTVLVWIAVSAFFAVAIDPIVRLFRKYLKLRRSLAIALVYVLGAGLIAGIAFAFVPPVIDAVNELRDDVPQYVEDLRDSAFVQRLDEDYDILDRIEEETTDTLSGVGPDTAVEIGQRVVNGIIALISIAVLTFLFSLYGPMMRLRAISSVDEGIRRESVERLLDRLRRVIVGYVFGVLLIAVIAGVAAYVFLTIADVPFALLLAFWAGLMSLIPLVGAAIGAIPYIIVSFFVGWPIGVAAIVFWAVYQQVENNLFQPTIHRFTVQLNPLLVIIAVLIGAQLLGFVGVLVAIPVAGMIQVLFQEWLRYRREVKDGSEPETEQTAAVE
jgi:predicted PurR-regulated permease PerM